MLSEVKGPLVERAALFSLAAIVAAAAVVRFVDLGARSFWRDEAVTSELVHRSFGSMLSSLPGSESTPPLYYVLLWIWSRVFGSGEAGLRSLSALAGTATVVVVYAIAAELLSRRAALIASALAAVSPLLVWHSQDARSYALLMFFGSLSFLFFVRSLRDPTRRSLGLWALASALALTTHYFALFAIAPEALWLFVSAGRAARVASATAVVAAVGGALAPLALAQRSNASWITEVSRARRIDEVAKEFLVGPQAPHTRAASGLAGLLVVTALVLVARYGRERERRASAVAGGIGACALLLPLLLSVVGLDYVLARNLIVAWTPIVVVVACGLAVSRLPLVGLSAAAALVALALWIDVATAHTPKFRAEDWRGAARAIGSPDTERAIVVLPDAGIDPLLVYRRGSRPFPPGGARVQEVVVVAIGPSHRELGRDGRYPLPPSRLFRVVGRVERRYFTDLRLRSSKPRLVTPAVLGIGRPGFRSASALLDGGPAGSR